MKVTPTKAFVRDLKRLSSLDAEAAISALQMFVDTPSLPRLNFEKVKHRSGYFTIRASYSVRILMSETAPKEFDAVAIGNHDYIYASYFKK
jgi:hypothetical protein